MVVSDSEDQELVSTFNRPFDLTPPMPSQPEPMGIPPLTEQPEPMEESVSILLDINLTPPMPEPESEESPTIYVPLEIKEEMDLRRDCPGNVRICRG